LAGVFRARGRLPREPAVKLDICKGSVSSTTKQGAMLDNREPEVTGAPSADARSVEAVVEAVAGARGPANFTLVMPANRSKHRKLPQISTAA